MPTKQMPTKAFGKYTTCNYLLGLRSGKWITEKLQLKPDCWKQNIQIVFRTKSVVKLFFRSKSKVKMDDLENDQGTAHDLINLQWKRKTDQTMQATHFPTAWCKRGYDFRHSWLQKIIWFRGRMKQVVAALCAHYVYTNIFLMSKGYF